MGEAEEEDGPSFCPLAQADHILMKPIVWMGKLRLGVGHLVSLATARGQNQQNPVEQ